MTPKPPAPKKQPKTGSKSPPEASAEFKAFEKVLKQVLSVPKEELDRREAEYKEQRRSK